MTVQLKRVVVLDTSVVAKWFKGGEPLAAEAKALRQAYYEDRLSIITPDLVPYELANVLRYSAEVTKTDSLSAMESLYALGVEIAPATLALIKRGLELAYQYDMAVYDAAFIALAEDLQADFVTADEKLLRKVTGLPFCHFLGDVVAPPIPTEE